MDRIPYIGNYHSWKEEFSFYVEIKTRFAETDMMGHINHRYALVYFEQARIDFFTEANVLRDKDRENGFVVGDMQVNYINEIYHGDNLKIYVKAASIGNSSVELHYLAINQDDLVCLTGRGRVVKINLKERKPEALTEEE